MRRRLLHGFLVGVLTCSLALDTARACGLRRGCHGRPCLAVPCAVPCQPVAWTVVPAGPWCAPAPVSCGPWAMWGEPVAASWCVADGGAVEVVVTEPACGGWVSADHVVGEVADSCCGGEEVVLAETAAGDAPLVEAAPESVGAESPATTATNEQPLVAESIVAPPADSAAGLAPAPQPVPDLQAVEPASATEPAGDVELPPVAPPAVAPEPAPVEAARPPLPAEPAPVAPPEAPAAEPVEENLFEEAARDPAAATSSAVPAELPAVGAPAVEPAAGGEFEPLDTESEPAATEPAAPANEPGEPAQEPQPEPAAAAAAEPARRWIDSSGRYATVGVLVAVRGEAVEIRTATGRSITVPLARLSEFDRGYADAAAARLASRGPAARDTAGL